MRHAVVGDGKARTALAPHTHAWALSMTAVLLLVAACGVIALVGWIVSKVKGSHAFFIESWQFDDGETILWRDDAADVAVIPKLGQAVSMTPARLHRWPVVVTNSRVTVGNKTLTRKAVVQYVLYPGVAPDGQSKHLDGGLLSRGYSTVVIVRGTRPEAEAELTRLLRERDAGGGRRVTSKETFDAYATRWLESRKHRAEPGTIEAYQKHLDIRLLPTFGRLKLRQVTRERVEAYVRELDRAGTLSAKTINDSLVPLRQIMARAAVLARPGARHRPADGRARGRALPRARGRLHPGR